MKILSTKVLIVSSVFLSGMSLLGCDKTTEETSPPSLQVAVGSTYDRSKIDPTRIKQGRDLFLKNCMVCHGFDAEGAPDWRKRDAEGKFPAPPLNGTGHAWHHPQNALMYTIRNGTKALGGNMPGWKDKLSEQEIESIIFWFQSKWPDELYQAWARVDKESN